jgi:YVTN family beta-propeller protein
VKQPIATMRRDRSRPRALAIAATWLVLGAAALEARDGPIYVSDEDRGEVVEIAGSPVHVVRRIGVGKRPRGLKISRDGKRLYVALSGSPKGGPGTDKSKLPARDAGADGIGVIDLDSGQLVKIHPSGPDPEAFDESNDGRRLYISNEETAELSVLDLAAGEVVKRIAVGEEPEGVTVRPDGKVVYVTCEAENAVVAVDTATLEIIGRIATGARPRSVTFSKDGTLAFIASELAASVTIADAVSQSALGTIMIAPSGNAPMPPRPMGTALSRDGKQLFVTTGRGESIAVIDVATRSVAHMIAGVGTRPWGVAVSRDGATLYTANGLSGDVSVIDLPSHKIRRRIRIGGSPWGVAVAGSISTSPLPPTDVARH